MINIIIVDDHELFRLGIRAAIESKYSDLRIVGEVESGTELFTLLKSVVPDILLLDIALPDISGIEIARRLKTEYPKIKVLTISAENSALTVSAMLEIGIEGFISKRHGSMDTVIQAIRSIGQGLDFFGKDISDIIYRIYVSKKQTTEVTSEFTPQEKRVIELCREGLPAKLIADRLSISVRTVNNHKNHIFRKLDFTNTMEMVQYALKNGIIQSDS